MQRAGADPLRRDCDEDINKQRCGAYSHNQIRRRVDEIIKVNARSLSDFVCRPISDKSSDAVVLAGDVQGRAAVKAELWVRAEVAEAVERGVVATLLLDEAEASGVEAAIIAQDILSSADIGLSHESMPEGIAAIHRYDVAAALVIWSESI